MGSRSRFPGGVSGPRAVTGCERSRTFVPELRCAVSLLRGDSFMPIALRVRRRRLLVVGLGAALLVPLSVGPAGAQTPAAPAGSTLAAAGGTVVGKLVRAVADPRKADLKKNSRAA